MCDWKSARDRKSPRPRRDSVARQPRTSPGSPPACTGHSNDMDCPAMPRPPSACAAGFGLELGVSSLDPRGRAFDGHAMLVAQDNPPLVWLKEVKRIYFADSFWRSGYGNEAELPGRAQNGITVG